MINNECNYLLLNSFKILLLRVQQLPGEALRFKLA
jgi:hypothetical protein